jgi:hypothetical protein
MALSFAILDAICASIDILLRAVVDQIILPCVLCNFCIVHGRTWRLALAHKHSLLGYSVCVFNLCHIFEYLLKSF